MSDYQFQSKGPKVYLCLIYDILIMLSFYFYFQDTQHIIEKHPGSYRRQ